MRENAGDERTSGFWPERPKGWHFHQLRGGNAGAAGCGAGAGIRAGAAEPRLKACSIPAASDPAPLRVPSAGGGPGASPWASPLSFLRPTCSTAGPATCPLAAARKGASPRLGGRRGQDSSLRRAVAAGRAGSVGGDGRERARPSESVPGWTGAPLSTSRRQGPQSTGETSLSSESQRQTERH